jgi:hypothetical protein
MGSWGIGCSARHCAMLVGAIVITLAILTEACRQVPNRLAQVDSKYRWPYHPILQSVCISSLHQLAAWFYTSIPFCPRGAICQQKSLFELPSCMAGRGPVAHNLPHQILSRRRLPNRIREHASNARQEGRR